MNKKNSVILIGIIIILIIAFVLYLRRPKISIIPDWDKKTFKYKLSVNGCSFEGERSMIDNRPILYQMADTKECGKYEFEVHKDTAFIWEAGNSNALKVISIDIPSKSINENQAVR